MWMPRMWMPIGVYRTAPLPILPIPPPMPRKEYVRPVFKPSKKATKPLTSVVPLEKFETPSIVIPN